MEIVSDITDQNVEAETHVRVKINGSTQVFCKAWLTEGGRAAGSVLAKMILGTQEGLKKSSEIKIDDDLFLGIGALMTWLEQGILHLTGFILHDKDTVSALEDLADYFGLAKLHDDIRKEKERLRDKKDEFNVSKSLLARLRVSDCPRIVTSTENIGVVFRFHECREFGTLIDSATRDEIWFQKTSVVRDDDGSYSFGIGLDVTYDIQISERGKKPGSAEAINIRPLGGISFTTDHRPR